MQFGIAYLALACTLAASGNNNNNEVSAFSPQTTATRTATGMMTNNAPFVTTQFRTPSTSSSSSLFMSEEPSSTKEEDEISRLKAMAQKLRAEAAALQSDMMEERSNVARIAFEKFDNDSDGNISLAELKSGLQASLKTEISDERVQKLMNKFDVSGDGYLQLEEMVSVDQFRNQLEAFSREEKSLARDASIEAVKEKQKAEKAEERMALLNDKAPTQSDKVLSVLPYLFPLLDSLQFGRFFFMDNADNPVVGLVGLGYAAYRAVPFSGFIAFIALNTLSGNPGLNKLIRFNMQQAIFVDIALFFPGLLTALIGGLGSVVGFQIPEAIQQTGSTAIFGALILLVTYASISSLLGILPDKIPIISSAVGDRMPSIDMFDDEGKFVPRDPKNKDDKKDDETKKD